MTDIRITSYLVISLYSEHFYPIHYSDLFRTHICVKWQISVVLHIRITSYFHHFIAFITLDSKSAFRSSPNIYLCQMTNFSGWMTSCHIHVMHFFVIPLFSLLLILILHSNLVEQIFVSNDKFQLLNDVIITSFHCFHNILTTIYHSDLVRTNFCVKLQISVFVWCQNYVIFSHFIVFMAFCPTPSFRSSQNIFVKIKFQYLYVRITSYFVI